MGYSTNVSVDAIRDTANKVSRYITTHQREMNGVNSEMVALRNVEKGTEFELLQTKWNSVNGPNSTSAKMINCMESYASYLQSCARYYEIVQNNARIRASQIY